MPAARVKAECIPGLPLGIFSWLFPDLSRPCRFRWRHEVIDKGHLPVLTRRRLTSICNAISMMENPSGNSGTYGEVVKLARSLSVRAIERLGELLESPDERVVVVAANAILDRAYGKPRLSAEKPMGLEDRIAAMSPGERRARLLDLQEKAREYLEEDSGYLVIEAEVEEV